MIARSAIRWLSPSCCRGVHCFSHAPNVSRGRFEVEWGSVLPDFITKTEERALALHCHGLLTCKPYDTGHWDRVISQFREAELDMGSLPEDVHAIVARLTGLFRDGHQAEPRVHTIDLAEDGGHIDGHIDSVKFCGDHIIGLSLLSPSVLRMTRAAPDEVVRGSEELAGFQRAPLARHPGHAGPGGEADLLHAHSAQAVLWEPEEGTGRAGEFVDVLLPRRSAYVMHGVGRYGFLHAILGQKGDGTASPESELQVGLQKRRRISVIVRDAPRAKFAVNPNEA